MDGRGELVHIFGEFIVVHQAIQVLEGGNAHLVVQIGLEGLEVIVLYHVSNGVCIGLNGILVAVQRHQAGTVLLHQGVIPLVKFCEFFLYGFALAAHHAHQDGGCNKKYVLFHIQFFFNLQRYTKIQ